MELKVWLDHFVSYPKWKIDKLVDYSLDDRGGGRTLSHVCKYLDELRPEPGSETVREDLGYKRTPFMPSKEVTKHMRALMDVILDSSGKYSEQEKDEYERNHVLMMREKFPNTNWQCGRKANRNV